ncbi:hypothetical protein [Kitasatospora sp. GAS1066B]|uniref:hypothetical protein n=1 Tax=Kitasatospora sp. GAS1066B TaxID=3156271 RepID=UPI00351957DD
MISSPKQEGGASVLSGAHVLGSAARPVKYLTYHQNWFLVENLMKAQKFSFDSAVPWRGVDDLDCSGGARDVDLMAIADFD